MYILLYSNYYAKLQGRCKEEQRQCLPHGQIIEICNGMDGGGGIVAEWLRRVTRKIKARTAVGSNPALDSLVAVRNSSQGRPEPCEGNLVAAAGSCGGLMVKHPCPLLEISLSDFRGLATLSINAYLPNYLPLTRPIEVLADRANKVIR